MDYADEQTFESWSDAISSLVGTNADLAVHAYYEAKADEAMAAYFAEADKDMHA